jgi:cell division protein FtsB
LKKKRGSQLPLTQFTQFIAIIVLTICVFLVVGFARRTAATYKIRNEAVRLEEKAVAARARRQDLQARLEYVQSDAYVEEIARTEFKWAREGETAIVVMPTPQAVPPSPPDQQPAIADAPPPQSPWQAWWFIFFERLPPIM